MLAYPFRPHTTHVADQVAFIKIVRGTDTLEEAHRFIEGYCRDRIAEYANSFIDDLLQLSVANALQHTQNADTLALATQRIPNGTLDDTLRFVIAFTHEWALGMDGFVADAKASIVQVDRRYRIVTSGGKFRTSIDADEHLQVWANRADTIVDLMKTAKQKVDGLSRNADFIRNAALIKLGEKTGLEIATAGNTLMLGVTENNWMNYYPMLHSQSFFIERIEGVRYPAQKENATDTFTITAKNGPSLIQVKASPTDIRKAVLAKDASRTFTLTEMGYAITSETIEVPVVATPIANQSVEVTTTQSVTFTGTFTGTRLSYSVSSSQESVATVTLSDDATILAIAAVAAGNTTITLTATNEAGSVSTEFIVTVTPRTEE